MSLTRILGYDFNSPANPGGFYEVVNDRYLEPPKIGDEVIIGDSELRTRGRVRAIVVVVEPPEGGFVYEDLDAEDER